LGGFNPDYDENSYMNIPTGILEELDPLTSEEKEREKYVYGGRRRDIKSGTIIDTFV